jgi:hypothetical protein
LANQRATENATSVAGLCGAASPHFWYQPGQFSVNMCGWFGKASACFSIQLSQ